MEIPFGNGICRAVTPWQPLGNCNTSGCHNMTALQVPRPTVPRLMSFVPRPQSKKSINLLSVFKKVVLLRPR